MSYDSIKDNDDETELFAGLYKKEIENYVKYAGNQKLVSGSNCATELRMKFVNHLKDLKTQNASGSIRDNIDEAFKRAFDNLHAYGART